MMMTMTDERLDLEMFEGLDESDDANVCSTYGCQREPDWVAIWSCGHAQPYCNEHMDYFERMARAGDLYCEKNPTHLVRKEPFK